MPNGRCARRSKRLFALGVAGLLLAALSVPAATGPDKVIKQTGKDATTMSADTVWNNGGVYGNDCVADAIDAGYKGKVNLIQPAGNPDVILGMSFENLLAGTYTVFIDWDGGTPGGWGSVGTFVADESGNGSFNCTVPAGVLPDGNHTWGVWVNGPTESSCGSILQTDIDLTFTTGS